MVGHAARFLQRYQYHTVHSLILPQKQVWILHILLALPPQKSSILCSIRALLIPNCSTEYSTSIIGGSLTSRCKDGNDELSYPKLTEKTSNIRFETGWIDLEKT